LFCSSINEGKEIFFDINVRSKSWQGESGSSKAYSSGDSNFAARATANALLKSGSTRYTLHLLYYLLNYWKNKEVEEASFKVGGNLLKNQPLHSPPDMSPFFLKQYVKTHAHDIFEAYPQLLTEMALRWQSFKSFFFTDPDGE